MKTFEDTLLPYLNKDQIDDLLKSISSGVPSHCALLNTKKISDEEFLSKCPNAKPHPIVPHCYCFDPMEYPLGKSVLFESGAIYIQEPSSAIPAFLLNPKDDERILDLCAAPGGKSVGLSLLNDSSTIISNDLSHSRALTLSSNIERMGLGNIVVTCNDFEKIYTLYENYFDAIILDAPCSGSATFRKDNEAHEDWTIEKVYRCQAIQSRLLEIAFSMLKEGGRLVYSTCSFSYEEDEGVVLPFLKSHPNAKALKTLESPLLVSSNDLKEGIHMLPTSYHWEGQFAILIQKEGTKTENSDKPIAKKDNPLYKEFYLENRSNVTLNGSFYSLNKPIQTRGLSILRYGVKILDEESPHIPDFHLSHFLSQNDKHAIELNESEIRKYLNGETIAIKGEDGVKLICFENRPLGFGKLVKGILKNHYPKGLRRNRDSIRL